MSQPILTIAEEQDAPTALVNLLPCRVQHDGVVEPVDSFWTPSKSEDGTSTAYLRGRKLQGRTVPLPAHYRGVVMQRKKEDKPAAEAVPQFSAQEVISLDDDDGNGQEAATESGKMQVTAKFDNMVIWGHEQLVNATDDVYVRGIEEWLEVSNKIHSYEK